MRSLAYFALNDFQRIKVDLDETLRIDPDNSRAHFMLAWYYLSVLDDKKAVASWKRAFELNPGLDASSEKSFNALVEKIKDTQPVEVREERESPIVLAKLQGVRETIEGAPAKPQLVREKTVVLQHMVLH